MSEEYIEVPVEYDLRPAYFDHFRCLAGGCRFTCCKGWRVTFHKRDYQSLKRQSGSPELNANMKKALRRLKKDSLGEQFYGEFDVKDGHCPLQRGDGLCSLQLEKGHDALPEVCRVFPRKEGVTCSAFLERSLSPACEGVLELLWNLPDGVDFISDPLLKKERCFVKVESDFLHLRFQSIRAQCIDFLQNRRHPLHQRIALMGLALRELVDGETDIDRWLVRAQTLAKRPDIAEKLQLADREKALFMFLTNNIKVLTTVHEENDDFYMVLKEILDGLGIEHKEDSTVASLPTAPYRKAQKHFEEVFKGRDYFMENLMVTLFFLWSLPRVDSTETLWKEYVNFCSLYSFYRFMAVMSCREGACGDKDELFRLMVYASRKLLHNHFRKTDIQNELFQNDSATLAHMVILLNG